MNKRFNIEFCRAVAESRGGLCLSKTYTNTESKLTWQCELKHKWSATLDSIKNSGSWCPECAKSIRAKTKKLNHPPKIDKNTVENYHKEYYKQNKERVLKQNKTYSKNNKNKIKKLNAKWKKNNKTKIAKSRKKLLDNNLNSKLADRLRSRIKNAIKNNQKSGSAVSDLGCSIEELKKHLESQFQPGMSWENWTTDGWHIDHIKPLSSFDLTDPEEFKRACNFTNLQPLWAGDNIRKSDNYEEHNE